MDSDKELLLNELLDRTQIIIDDIIMQFVFGHGLNIELISALQNLYDDINEYRNINN